MEDKLKTVSDVLQTADIALDSYDDIFSDFDPSPYTTRILSEDFLFELHRRYPYMHKGNLKVDLTIPQSLRSEKTEHLIRKRIRDHFRERMRSIDFRSREKVMSGLLRFVIGIAITLAIFFFPVLESPPILTLLSVLIWYTLWSGFEYVFEVSQRLRKKRDRAEVFMKADYNFMPQEVVVETIQKLSATQKEDQRSQGSS